MNTYRPNIFTDQDRAWWAKFQNAVRNSTIEIGVNGVFDYIQSVIDGGTCYGGGGFAYMFWFRTLEDRTTFIAECVATFADDYPFDPSCLSLS